MFFAITVGVSSPAFGYFIAKSIFGLMIPNADLMQEKVNGYVSWMVGLAFYAGFAMFAGKYAFSHVRENIALNVRMGLYDSVI